MIGYEFEDPKVPRHRCEVLDVKKVSATKSILFCVFCGREAGVWIEEKPKTEYPTEDAKYFDESTLKRYA